MSIAALPLVGPSTSEPASVDVAGLSEALTRTVAGEVRFDRLSRALYSTDASVYQIVPLGVVVPRGEDDVRATLEACRRVGAPLAGRGGGAPQTGPATRPRGAGAC